MGRHPEYDHQCAYFDWVRIMCNQDKRYQCIYAVEQGVAFGGHEKHRKNIWERLLKQGVRPGILDITIACPSNGRPGAYIEMKAGKNKTSTAQDTQIELHRWAGYKVAVCWNSEEAQLFTEEYFKLSS